MTVALIAAGSACSPLVEGAAAAQPRHHHAHRSAHLRHHVVSAPKKRKALLVEGHKLVWRTSRKVSPAAPTISLKGNVVSWGASYGSSELRGAISTAPRGAADRQTTYVSLSTGTSWTLRPEPGETLYYGVEIAGRWSADEAKVSWSAASGATKTDPASPTSASPTSKGASSATTSIPTATPGTSGAGSTGTTTSGSSSPMLVGINEQGWGTSAASDIASSFNLDRMDVAGGEDASDFWTRGVAVDMLFSGPYNTGGVSAINATSWVQSTLSTFQSECDGSATNCPAVEVLNEPYGSWFWGPNAEDATNEAAYAHLVADTYMAFHNQYGSASPKILAAFDDDSWWQGMEAAVPNIDSYVDGVTVHPYGGTGGVASSALGDQALVIDAHQTTGRPIWASEFGWPTAVGQPATGDSLQWGFSQQATNTYNFVTWLRSLGYVSAAIDFNYRDYGTNAFYGVETSAGVKKPSWTALAEAADQQPCTVCNS
jgi:hypothetical protein